MTEGTVSQALFDYLASDVGGATDALREIADHSGHRLADAVDAALRACDASMVDERRRATDFIAMYGNRAQDFQDREARLDLIDRAIGQQIATRRIRLLVESDERDRPLPYNHAALRDLDIDADGLVPLRFFEVDGLVLRRNGHAFSLLPPTERSYSAYWFMQAVRKCELHDRMSVRLDPLLHRPEADTHGPHFRMRLYGEQLSLVELLALSEERFGRWVPGNLSGPIEFTDYSWLPRNDELHLTIEELPKRDDIHTRGSRYLHSIFNRQSSCCIHLDGALRYFTDLEWAARAETRVGRAGKAGTRIKVFRLDASVDSEIVTSLCSPFFVGNYDVAKFCGMDVHPLLLGSTSTM